MIILNDISVKSVKADMVSGQVTLTFVLSLDNEALQKARRVLTVMALDGTPLTVTIDPHSKQMSLLPDENTTATIQVKQFNGQTGEVYDFDKVYSAVMGSDTQP